MKHKSHCCRVCGAYYKDFYPWGEDGKVCSYEICLCCGVQFGYGDETHEMIDEFRKKWIKDGAKWKDRDGQPKHWNVVQQLEHILDRETVEKLLRDNENVD